MKRSFILQDLSPFSINSTNCVVNGRLIKTSAARNWQMQVFHRLSTKQNEKMFDELRAYFKPATHYFAVEILVAYPASDFYTKKKMISAHTMDVSNFEKNLVDCFFLPKYAQREAPQGCKNLQIDDKYICSLKSEKRVTSSDSNPSIRLSIEILPLSGVELSI